LIAAAEAEGRLTIYTAQSQATAEATIAAFNAVYPKIQVDLLRLASGPLMNRYAGEAETGVFEADVMNSSSTTLFSQFPQWWLTLDDTLVPNLATWPQQHIHGNYLTSLQGEQLLAYNPNLIRGPLVPRSWDDVLKPEYKGRAMMLDPRSSPTYMSWALLMMETYGEQFLERLGQQEFVLVEGGTQGTQQVAAGAYLFVFPPSFAHANPLMKQGAPLDVVFPADNSPTPAHGPEHYWALPSKSKNPNAARLFMHWYLTEEAQQVNCATQAQASVLLTDYPDCPLAKDDYMSADRNIDEETRAKILRLLNLE
jgi:iron(III) transport system substrate-binding protein